MRIMMTRKKNQYEYDEFEEENIDTKKQAQRDRNRKKQRRLKNALKSITHLQIPKQMNPMKSICRGMNYKHI